MSRSDVVQHVLEKSHFERFGLHDQQRCSSTLAHFDTTSFVDTRKEHSSMTSSPAASLPPELLFEIFSQFEDVEGEADQQSLKHATLVCRAWADPAQSVLWQSGATLEGDDDVRKFIRTAPRRRVGPKDISIFNLRRVELLDALWPHVEGIETLLVGSQGGVISAETFEHSALSGSSRKAQRLSSVPVL